MTAKKILWAVILATVSLPGAALRAGDDVWRAAATTAPMPTVTVGVPEPMAVAPAGPSSSGDVFPVTWREPAEPTTYVARGEPPDSVPPPSSGGPVLPPPPGEGFNQGVVIDRPLNHSFWEKCKGLFAFPGEKASSTGRCNCQSDRCFESMASPITSPFLFEDPRALTEIRPIFIYQKTPSGNAFGGGYSGFFGTQARLALSERLSLVINELGFVYLHPRDNATGFDGGTGFAQLMLGPKYTFYRCPESGTVAAGGLTFQIPTGPTRVAQDTGTLSLVPYLSLGQNFGRSSYGSFNYLGTVAYSASIDNRRSDYFYVGTHLDFDVANAHRIYPLIELNWYHYTSGGRGPALGFEGADLFNFGSSDVGRKNFVTIGPGVRYKFGFCENLSTGLAVEFPLTSQKELTNYRVTFDVIFRY